MYISRLPLETFKEVSIRDKAKALELFGTLLATASAYGMDFFLYGIENYYVEVASAPETGDVIYIRATQKISVCDLYLKGIKLPEL